MKIVSILLICAGASLSAGAQTVWRCGPGGSSYSATPCADGRAVDVADARSAAERQAAVDVAGRERRALASLAAERREREAEVVRRGLGPAGIRPLPVAAPVKADRERKKARRPPPFVARAY